MEVYIIEEKIKFRKKESVFLRKRFKIGKKISVSFVALIPGSVLSSPLARVKRLGLTLGICSYFAITQIDVFF